MERCEPNSIIGIGRNIGVHLFEEILHFGSVFVQDLNVSPVAIGTAAANFLKFRRDLFS